MDLPELSLAPNWSRLTPECSSSESSDTSSSRKRKAISDTFLENNRSLRAAHRNIIDLQHISERLPLDWEQCLDLESGKVYFLNRKTLKKSWDRPTTNKDQNHRHHQYKYNNSQKLDLELNISSPVSHKPKPASAATNKLQIARSTAGVANYKEKIKSNDNMMAMACMKCHMLVIVSKSSPTCPNCKFVHVIPPPAAQQTSPAPAPRKPTTTFRPLDTLTLFS